MVETKNCMESRDTGYPQVRVCEIVRSSGSCGFNLTKSKWDPYPWVSTVESGSPAEMAGVQAGDCLLEVNGEDILGLRIKEIANKVKARNETVTVMLWNSGVDPTCTPEVITERIQILHALKHSENNPYRLLIFLYGLVTITLNS